MPNYNAPIEDMMFLFEKLRNNKNYNEIEKYKELQKLHLILQKKEITKLHLVKNQM